MQQGQAGRQAARKNYELLRESGEKPNEKKKEMKKMKMRKQ